LSGDITAADVLSQGSCDLLSEIGWKLQHLRNLSCGRAPQERTSKRQAVCGRTHARNKGMDSAKLVLDANKATLRALAFWSSLAGTGSNPFKALEISC
jgi:hypothetical protein